MCSKLTGAALEHERKTTTPKYKNLHERKMEQLVATLAVELTPAAALVAIAGGGKGFGISFL